MSRRHGKFWTAGVLSLVFSSPLMASEETVNADAVFADIENPLVQPISHESFHEEHCSTNPGASLVTGGGLNLFMGVEATYLRPFQNGGTSTAEVLGGTTMNANNTDDFYGAPRIWLGAGIGDSPYFAQLQYWDLTADSTASLFGPTFAGQASSTLGATTFDFEGGRVFHLDAIDVDGKFTFGGRYANWDQSNQVNLAQGALLSGSNATAFGQSAFDGTGLTFSLQSTKKLGNSGWSLFGGTRFSWLWGEESGRALSSAAASALVLGSTVADFDSYQNNDAMLYIAEVQLGTQWQRRITCLNSDFFFRIALEYQYWNMDSSQEAIATTPGIPLTTVGAVARSGAMDMGLFGLAVGTGLTW
ncbi:hypothetical protein SH661x_002177 [Planctomicrobium sp. SH661]|uniref:hypothetical protein n=1 Tax=Planctomicrobium sp. SH661 TaxID=3448124 RepID=UPI003F5B77BB